MMATARRVGRDGQRSRDRHAGATTPFATRRLMRSRRRLREQLERAARFQRSLLPDVSAPIGGFRIASLYVPCEGVGGDFYDLAVRGDHALLLVADVMGHGVGAAFITMLVKAAFQETAADTIETAELLAEMNRRLHRFVPPELFVAAAVARLEVDGCGLQVANAGLPHPFLLRAAEGRVDEIGVDGFPLGLFEGLGLGSYDAARLRLAPGDVLLLSTDGVGSVESPQGRCFGEGRLREALDGLTGRDGRDVLDRLMSEAAAFGGGRPLPDDIDLVAISRRAPERRAAGA